MQQLKKINFWIIPLKKNCGVEEQCDFINLTIDVGVPKGGRIKKGLIVKYWHTFGYTMQMGVNVIML